MNKKQDENNEELYYNENGLVVFNEEYLLQRGYCCGNGCRHCPYNYKMVAEPLRTKLLQEREEREKNK